MALGIGLFLIWLLVSVMSVVVYLAMLSDDEDNIQIQFNNIERRIIVGCLIWPIPILIYVVFGILDIFEWAQDNMCKRLGR